MHTGYSINRPIEVDDVVPLEFKVVARFTLERKVPARFVYIPSLTLAEFAGRHAKTALEGGSKIAVAFEADVASDLLDLPIPTDKQHLRPAKALLAQVLEGTHPEVTLKLSPELRVVGANATRQLH